MLNNYLQNIAKTASTGQAREESFYPTLKDLLESYANSQKTELLATTLPKSTEAGNPDFRISGKKNSQIGYIEAKHPSITDLDKIEKTEQLKRYRETFPNLILTNFFEFRLYRNGDLIAQTTIGDPIIALELKTTPPAINQENLTQLLDQFISFSIPATTTARQLAEKLAKYTRFLRDQIIQEELREETKEGTQTLESYMLSFQRHLITSLTREQFADLFAQTITYGLFVAKSRTEGEFNRELADKSIPPTLGILRAMFKVIFVADLSPRISWLIDDIIEVLDRTDLSKITATFHKEGKGRDPIIHFYETFLAVYDPATREKRGVYYTPEQVVGYIVRSAHKLLQDPAHFNKSDGFADSSITILDPAAGTLTFPAEAVRQAADEFSQKYGKGGLSKLISEHFLKNFYAFELMMAPYVVGHLKIGFLLQELGYRPKDNDRFHLYLTNTLDLSPDIATLPGPLEQSLSDEQKNALAVKKSTPVMVVLGNPPYSGESANLNEVEIAITKGQIYFKNDKQLQATRDMKIKQKTFIGGLLEEYKQVNGQPLGEKNPKWLNDDYVKFFRFAQWKIDQLGHGILAFITNHAWLDNPTFRGMRASLLQSFDEAYILNLHGNSLKKEKAPDGGRDENVFDIRPGVAITILIKHSSAKDKKLVQYADLFGLREQKYQYLDSHDTSTTKWQTLTPSAPHYRLVPESAQDAATYEKFWPIQKIFPQSSVGIVTARDKLIIGWTPDEIYQRIVAFSGMDPELARSGYGLGPDAQDWQVTLAQKDLIDSGLDPNKITPILYRPFDIRWTYYTGRSKGFICRPRPEIMRHMLQSNLALLLHKREELDIPYAHFLVTDHISEHGALSSKTTSYQFPLYIYPVNPQLSIEQIGKTLNIDKSLLSALISTYQKSPEPEDILYYLYAIVYSPTYRQRYNDFLKQGFPRIPITANKELFRDLAKLGGELAELHLLKHPILDKPIAKFEGEGNSIVERVLYDPKTQRVYTGPEQYFTGIAPDTWEYMIGGYQVPQKWLKDRKGRPLSPDDIRTYCRIVTAIIKTIEIQTQLDKLYPQVEQTLISPAD